jgi:hypothetical protein
MCLFNKATKAILALVAFAAINARVAAKTPTCEEKVPIENLTQEDDAVHISLSKPTLVTDYVVTALAPTLMQVIPLSWVVVGSTDQSTWFVVDRAFNQRFDGSPEESVTYGVTHPGTFQYYKAMILNANESTSSEGAKPMITNLELCTTSSSKGMARLPSIKLFSPDLMFNPL